MNDGLYSKQSSLYFGSCFLDDARGQHVLAQFLGVRVTSRLCLIPRLQFTNQQLLFLQQLLNVHGDRSLDIIAQFLATNLEKIRKIIIIIINALGSSKQRCTQCALCNLGFLSVESTLDSSLSNNNR